MRNQVKIDLSKMEGDTISYICSTKQAKTLSEAIKKYCNRYNFKIIGIVKRDKYGTFAELENGIKIYAEFDR